MGKKIVRIYLLFILLPGACSVQKHTGYPEKKIEFEAENTITGRYKKCVLSMGYVKRLKPYGMFKIELNNEQSVILLPPYDKNAIRSKAEVKKFKGKIVTVTGHITEWTCLSEPTPTDSPQCVHIPCFLTIEEIKLAGDK